MHGEGRRKHERKSEEEITERGNNRKSKIQKIKLRGAGITSRKLR